MVSPLHCRWVTLKCLWGLGGGCCRKQALILLVSGVQAMHFFCSAASRWESCWGWSNHRESRDEDGAGLQKPHVSPWPGPAWMMGQGRQMPLLPVSPVELGLCICHEEILDWACTVTMFSATCPFLPSAQGLLGGFWSAGQCSALDCSHLTLLYFLEGMDFNVQILSIHGMWLRASGSASADLDFFICTGAEVAQSSVSCFQNGATAHTKCPGPSCAQIKCALGAVWIT